MAGRMAVKVYSLPTAVPVPKPGETATVLVVLRVRAVRIWLRNEGLGPINQFLQEMGAEAAQATPLAAVWDLGNKGWRHERIWRATELLTALNGGKYVADTPRPVEELTDIG